MSILLSKMTLERAKKFMGEEVDYYNTAVTLQDVREISNGENKILIAYFNEGRSIVNFTLLRDKEGKYLEDKQ